MAESGSEQLWETREERSRDTNTLSVSAKIIDGKVALTIAP